MEQPLTTVTSSRCRCLSQQKWSTLRNTLANYGNMNCVLTSESVDEDIQQLMQPVRSSLRAAVIALQYFTQSLTCRTGLFLGLSGEKASTKLSLTPRLLCASLAGRTGKNSACSVGYRIIERDSFFFLFLLTCTLTIFCLLALIDFCFAS